MRIFLLLSILIFSSCCTKTSVYKTEEDFQGIGVFGRRQELKVGERSYMNIPAFNLFIFRYHDSIFEIYQDSSGNRDCYLLDYSVKRRKFVDSLFEIMWNQDYQIPLKEYKGSCAGDIIYLGSRNGKTHFSGLPSEDELFFLFGGNVKKRSKIPSSKQPGIFEAKIYEFDSRYLRHYFSEEYLYKDLRVLGKDIEFNEL